MSDSPAEFIPSLLPLFDETPRMKLGCPSSDENSFERVSDKDVSDESSKIDLLIFRYKHQMKKGEISGYIFWVRFF